MPSQQPSLFSDSPATVPAPAGVVVREAHCRSVLNKCGVDDYSFNCYTGCIHACVYCYARFMQRFHPHDEEWGGFVDVKVNAPDVLARQVRRVKPGTVFTCSACDGWQAVEKHYELTRRCCRILLDAGFGLRVLTKSRLVLRDLDLFAGRDVRLGVTITTAHEATARAWEPRASSVAARVEVLKAARAAGLRTTVMFGPILPGLSDAPDALDALFALAAEAGVDRIWHDALNPRPCVWPAVQGLLRGRYPHLMDDYRRILFDPAAREAYTAMLHQRVRDAAARAGLSERLA